MADAGLRIAVEGEKEFKAALASVDVAVKNNNKSLRLLTEEYNLNSEGLNNLTKSQDVLAKQEEILATKGKVLSDSIAQQTEKVDLLDLRVEKAAKAYGEHDKRTEALRGQLLDASVALAKMTAEQEKNNKALEANKTAQLDAQHSTVEYEQAVEALSASVAANDAEIKRLTEAGKDLEKENGNLGRSSDDVKKRLENLQAANEKLTEKSDKLRDSITKQREITENLSKAQKEVVARYGEGSKESEAYRKKVADATTQLDRMESELKQTEKAIENNNKAIEDGESAPKGMISGLEKIEELTGVKIPGGIKEMIGGFDGGTLAVGGIVTALAGVAKKMEELWQESVSWAKDVTTKSAELDLSTEKYQELEYIAAATGTSVSDLTGALGKVEQKAADAAYTQETLKYKIAAMREEMEKAQDSRKYWSERWQETGDDVFLSQIDLATHKYNEAKAAMEELEKQADEATTYFDDLGISIYDENEAVKDSITLLYELIDAFAGIESEAIRNKEMNDLLGKSYNSLKPFLTEGSDGLKKMADEARRNNQIIGEEQVEALNKAAIAQDKYNLAQKRTTEAFAAQRTEATNLIDKLNLYFDQFFEQGSRFVGKIFGGYQYADGTDFHPGGYALVGERGPEIVRLPRGSAVYPNGTVPAGMSSTANTYNITIDARNIREFNDIVRYAQGARVAMRRG